MVLSTTAGKTGSLAGLHRAIIIYHEKKESLCCCLELKYSFTLYCVILYVQFMVIFL